MAKWIFKHQSILARNIIIIEVSIPLVQYCLAACWIAAAFSCGALGWAGVVCLTPTVNPLLCRAMVVEMDRDHMIELIDRKTWVVNECHRALLLALQGMARNGLPTVLFLNRALPEWNFRDHLIIIRPPHAFSSINTQRLKWWGTNWPSRWSTGNCHDIWLCSIE